MTVEIDYKRVETLASQGLSTKQIADCLGIARSTLYEHKKKNSDISDALKRGRSNGLREVTNALMENARSGNVTAQIFYLKNRDPDKWQDRRQNEHTGKDGKPIQIESKPFSFAEDD